jgi:hypothetical protein
VLSNHRNPCSIDIRAIIFLGDLILRETFSKLILNDLHNGGLINKPGAAVYVQEKTLDCILGDYLVSRPCSECLPVNLNHICSQIEFGESAYLHKVLLSQSLFHHTIEVVEDTSHLISCLICLLLIQVDMLVVREIDLMLPIFVVSLNGKHLISIDSQIIVDFFTYSSF